MALASKDLLDPHGASQAALRSCEETMRKFPVGTIDLVLVHPLRERFEWTDLPRFVKQCAEMKTYGLAAGENAYGVYGIPAEEGALAVIRPDGYVGTISPLTRPVDVEAYFKGCLLEV